MIRAGSGDRVRWRESNNERERGEERRGEERNEAGKIHGATRGRRCVYSACDTTCCHSAKRVYRCRAWAKFLSSLLECNWPADGNFARARSLREEHTRAVARSCERASELARVEESDTARETTM